jgi:hypothetical protein
MSDQRGRAAELAGKTIESSRERLDVQPSTRVVDEDRPRSGRGDQREEPCAHHEDCRRRRLREAIPAPHVSIAREDDRREQQWEDLGGTGEADPNPEGRGLAQVGGPKRQNQQDRDDRVQPLNGYGAFGERQRTSHPPAPLRTGSIAERPRGETHGERHGPYEAGPHFHAEEPLVGQRRTHQGERGEQKGEYNGRVLERNLQIGNLESPS